MNRLSIALISFAWVFTSVGLQTAAAQDEKRVAELEKKVAELEKKVATLEAVLKVTPKPDLDLKLVGSWAAPKPKGKGLAAMRFEADGKCRFVVSDEKDELATWYGVYEITGKEIRLTLNPQEFNGSGVVIRMAVVSMEGKQLVVKSNYFSAAEMKFEKQ